MARRIKFGDLIPVTTRIQWMLACRSVLASGVAILFLISPDARGRGWALVLLPLAWPIVTAVNLFLRRLGRTTTRVVFTASVVGDGVLLALAGAAAPDMQTTLRYVVVLHAVAVTLLASFRTGVRMALWHSMLNMLVVDAQMVGLSPQVGARPWYDYGLFLLALWTVVIGTASLAAMNERELRRRRQDSELLREFSLSVSSAVGPAAVAAVLAEFARGQLTSRRAAVLIQVQGDQFTELGYGFTVVADANSTVHGRVPGGELAQHPGSVFQPENRSRAILRRRIDDETDPWLSATLPDARDVVILPFRLDSFVGVFVIEANTSRWSRRVEQRTLEAAEQAMQHAGLALERALLVERIRLTSQTDGLTGMANRRRFDEVLEAGLDQAGPDQAGLEQVGLALILVDIDHFKKLNDTHGHLAGDAVLRDVARALRAATDEAHVVARYGGEEFAVVLPGTDLDAACAAAERLRAAVEDLATIAPVTISLGVAVSPQDGLVPQDLIAAADAGLYHSKDQGRNRVTAVAVTRTKQAA